MDSNTMNSFKDYADQVSPALTQWGAGGGDPRSVSTTSTSREVAEVCQSESSIDWVALAVFRPSSSHIGTASPVSFPLVPHLLLLYPVIWACIHGPTRNIASEGLTSTDCPAFQLGRFKLSATIDRQPVAHNLVVSLADCNLQLP